MKKLLVMVALALLASSPTIAAEVSDMELLQQGTAYLSSQNYQKAAQAFKEAARLNPANAEAFTGVGMAYMGIGNTDTATNVEVVENAVAAFKEALRLNPGSADARYQLGVAYLILHDKKGAVKQLEALTDLDEGMAQRLQARIAAYKQPTSFGKVSTRIGGDKVDSTRITMSGNHALVPVTLTHGSSTIQASLVLDTGASSTLITKDLAQRLHMNLSSASVARFQVADGRVVQAWQMKLDKVTVGPKARSGLDVVIVEGGKDFPFEGLLGMDFLRSFKHSIDVGNQVINWTP